MSTLRAYLGVASLTDVGYRLYTQTTPVAARQTAGVTDEGAGWYSVAGVTLAGDHVRWDSLGDATATAREDFAMRIPLEAIFAKLPSSSRLAGSANADGSISVDVGNIEVSGWTDEQIATVAAIKARTDLIATGRLTVLSPVSEDGTLIKLFRGDSYYQVDGRALSWSSDDFPDLAGATVVVKIGAALELSATLTGARAFRVEPTNVQTATLTGTNYPFQAQATLANGHEVTFLKGDVYVEKKL